MVFFILKMFRMKKDLNPDFLYVVHSWNLFLSQRAGLLMM